MIRICEAISCVCGIRAGSFLCRQHWNALPLEIRRVINSRYLAGKANFAFLSDVVYLQAAVDAINWLAKYEDVEGPNPYARHLKLAQQRADIAAKKKDYVIAIAPNHLQSFLTAEPEEVDGEKTSGPPRSADVSMALRFNDFSVARRAVFTAAEKYPQHQFQMQVAEALK